MGLLAQTNQHPIRPSFFARLPAPRRAAPWNLSLIETVANTWTFNPGDYRADFGSLATALTVSRAVGEHTSVEVGVVDFSRTRSELDAITVVFHDLLSISQNDRDRFPRGDNVIELAERGDFTAVQDEHSGSVWRAWGLGIEHEVLHGIGGLPTVTAGLDLRYMDSTQGVLDDDDPWAVGISAGAARLLPWDLHAYFGASYAWHGQQRWHDDGLGSTQFGCRAGLEWHLSARRSCVLQYAYSDEVTLRRPPWNEPAHEILVGFAYRTEGGGRIELGLLENAVVFGTSPDFGFHLALSQGF